MSHAADRPRIAIVEDNPDNRLLLELLLEDEYDLIAYDNGADAVLFLPDAAPDLVLLDISMPEMDGMEVVQRLRRVPTLAQVPIVALTAHAMATDAARFLATGFSAYIRKPIVDHADFVQTIATLLASRPASPA